MPTPSNISRLASFDEKREIILNCATEIEEHLRRVSELMEVGNDAASAMNIYDETARTGPARIGRPDYKTMWSKSVAANAAVHLGGPVDTHVNSIKQASSLREFLGDWVEGQRQALVSAIESSN